MATKDKFFSPVNPAAQLDAAYCGAILEAISYTHSDALLELWRNAMGFPYAVKIATPNRLTPNLMIAGGPLRVVVAIPGTVNAAQMLQNVLNCAQRENPDFGPGRMHSFFLWCAESIVSFVQGQLAALPELQEICFIGHSLGGAVAQLLADWTAANTSIHVRLVQTFNSPRVGDPSWARRSRPFPTHNYYNSHDMVVELPPNVIPSTTAYQTELGFIDAYEHRDTLLPIESTRNIDESWYAIGISKVVYPVKWGLHSIAGAENAASIMRALGFVGSRAALASWFLPLPTWILEHSIDSVLDNIERMRNFVPPGENAAMVNLRAAIQAEGQYGVNPYNPSVALVPPSLFHGGQVPPAFDTTALPAPTPGRRFEIIETACQWINAPGGDPLPNLAYIDDEFTAALANRAPSSPNGNPLLSPTPIIADIPAAPHWYYRGHDRRLLEALRKCLDGIDRQDGIRYGDAYSSRISTFEPIFDWEDSESNDALATIRGRIVFLLGLTRD